MRVLPKNEKPLCQQSFHMKIVKQTEQNHEYYNYSLQLFST